MLRVFEGMASKPTIKERSSVSCCILLGLIAVIFLSGKSGRKHAYGTLSDFNVHRS